jgi:hypothetical protein
MPGSSRCPARTVPRDGSIKMVKYNTVHYND